MQIKTRLLEHLDLTISPFQKTIEPLRWGSWTSEVNGRALPTAPLPFQSSDSGPKKWKLCCWLSFSKPRQLGLQHRYPSPLWAGPWRPSSRSTLPPPALPLQVQSQLRPRPLLLQEEIADVDAIVDQQLWHTRMHKQRLTRLPWQLLNLALLQCLFRHALRRHHLWIGGWSRLWRGRSTSLDPPSLS